MADKNQAESERVLDFWFEGSTADTIAFQQQFKRWFAGGEDFDKSIEREFSELMEQAENGSLDAWAETASSRLALILILDQFFRNVHRGTEKAFRFDEAACALAVDGVKTGMDKELSRLERVFFYMPFQHAEDMGIQKLSIEKFGELVSEAPEESKAAYRNTLDFAKKHLDIIARFGRFPHRNAVLNRTPTKEEEDYLASGGDSFGQ